MHLGQAPKLVMLQALGLVFLKILSDMKTKNAWLLSWSLNTFIFLLTFLLLSCVSPRHKAITGYDYRKLTTYKSETLTLSNLEYKKIAKGIFIARIENEKLPLIATIAKINLKEQSLKIVGTEEERFRLKGSCAGFVEPETTLSFAKRCDTNLAINANFFTFKTSFFDKLYKPLGLFLNNGKLLSSPNEAFGSMTFDKENLASVSDEDVKNAHFGIAGYNKVIEAGTVILKGKSRRIDSRTLIGVNERGDELFILLIDGERKALSCGLALIDAANLFLQLGVFYGIELDGGGSATLIAKIDGVQHQLVPSSKKQCRRVAINLGFILK